jgi:FkbM family methyltransferase
LEKNLDEKPNVEIVPSAVGAAQGKARFTLECLSELSHLANSEDKAGNQIEVDVVTIDAFAASRGLTVEAIKIDAEGHDTEIIEGSLAVLAQQRPLVLTEARPDAHLFDLTRKVAYRVFAYIRHPLTRAKSFAELFADVPIPGETKMLFLVPDRLAEEIVIQSSR